VVGLVLKGDFRFIGNSIYFEGVELSGLLLQRRLGVCRRQIGYA
jgi:hypothetical protein